VEISFSKIKTFIKSSSVGSFFHTKPKKFLDLPSGLNISGNPEKDFVSITSVLPSIGTMKNNVLRVKKNIIGEHNFIDNGKKVGFADFSILTSQYGFKGKFPEDWFVEGAKPDKKGRYLLKPHMYINELSMKDRINRKQLVKRDKKYGAMAMQHLLQIAQDKGCETRIMLMADTLGKTGFKPGRFYHKMGFSVSPKRTQMLEKIEADYVSRVDTLQKQGVGNDEIEKYLTRTFPVSKPQKVNGRYIEESGYMFLTNPECILNYPI
jgi:hypothetical protein